jgi:hypothetical protein
LLIQARRTIINTPAGAPYRWLSMARVYKGNNDMDNYVESLNRYGHQYDPTIICPNLQFT